MAWRISNIADFILTLIQNPLLAFRDFQTFRHEAVGSLVNEAVA